jgi:hypothetical protein
MSTLATCPACNGSKRKSAADNPYRKITAGYDPATDTLACSNCGGQTMSGIASGKVPIDPATGLGCEHSYVIHSGGRCYHIYTCRKCGHRYDIDSGD